MSHSKEETNSPQELSNRETLVLLDDLIINLSSVANIARRGKRGFPDIHGTGPKFDDNIKSLTAENSLPSPTKETAQKTALFILGILHQESLYQLVFNGYTSAKSVSILIEKQLELENEEAASSLAFLEKIRSEIESEELQYIRPEAISSESSKFIEEALKEASSNDIILMSDIVCTEEFASDNPEAVISFVNKIGEITSQLISSQSFEELGKLFEAIDPSTFSQIRAALNKNKKGLGNPPEDTDALERAESNLAQLEISLTKIGENLIPLFNIDFILENHELSVKLLEWQYVFQQNFSPELTLKSIQTVSQLFAELMEAVTGEKRDLMIEEPAIVTSAINTTLGYILETFAPDYSPLVNDYAIKLTEFKEEETLQSWLNLVELTPAIKLAILTINSMEESSVKEAITSPFINAKNKLDRIIGQSPDIINLLKESLAQEFASKFFDQSSLLKGIKKTTGKWLELISEGLSSEEEDLSDQKSAKFLLNRLHIMLFVTKEEQESEPAQKLEDYLNRLEASLDQEDSDKLNELANEFEISILDLLKGEIAKTFIEPNAKQIAIQINQNPENQESLAKKIVSILEILPSNEQDELSERLLTISDDNKRNPAHLQILSGIIESQKEPTRIVEDLYVIIRNKQPQRALEKIAESVMRTLVKDHMVVGQHVQKTGLPENIQEEFYW